MKRLIIVMVMISMIYSITGCSKMQIEVGVNEQHIIVYKDKLNVTKYYTTENISFYIELSEQEIVNKNDEELLELLNNTSKQITYNTLEKDQYGYKVNYERTNVGYLCNDDIISDAYEVIGSESRCIVRQSKRLFKNEVFTNVFYNNDNGQNIKYDNYIGKNIYQYSHDVPLSSIEKTYLTLPGKILIVGVLGNEGAVVSLINDKTIEINETEDYIEMFIIFE